MPARDAITYTCVLCGRSGHRQFSPVDPNGPLPAGAYRCSNQGMCKERVRDAIATATAILPEPAVLMDDEKGAARWVADHTSVVGFDTTAHCLDCVRVWTVHDRNILQRAVEAHEINKPGHQVQVTI